MSKLEPEILHQYADGEVDTERALEVEKGLEADEQARAELDRVRKLGRLIREHVDGQVEDHPPRPMWEAVSRAIEHEAEPASASAGFSGWWKRTRPHERWPVWVGAAAAVAAIVALLWVTLAGDDGPVPSQAGKRGEPSNELVVESVDYQGRPPTFFQIPDRDGDGTTTVIWVSPEPSNGGEGEPEDRPSSEGSI
jgi:anti-sigma factor RsiW